jgi:hypothetical protein
MYGNQDIVVIIVVVHSKNQSTLIKKNGLIKISLNLVNDFIL